MRNERGFFSMPLWRVLVFSWFVCWTSLLTACREHPVEAPWNEFAPAGAGFSILMPGEAKEQTQRSPEGLVSKTYDMITVLNNVRGMGVGYTDLLSPPGTPADLERILDESRDRTRDNLKGELLTETPIRLGRYTGRELKFSYQKNYVVRARQYVAGQRLYNVMVITSPENVNCKEARRFFDSFKIP